jgi:RNA polymerase sigma-70 factor (ECF subfamily)
MSETDPALAATVALVAAAQAGDRAALDELFARYLPRVRRIAAVRMGRTAAQFLELDDLVQESMLDAFRSLQSGQHRSEGSFCNWLARCVEHNLRDLLRRRRAAKRGGGRELRQADAAASGSWAAALPGREPTPSQAAAAQELDDRIERALLALNQRYREILVLRIGCGLSARESAAEIGAATVADAQKLFERARRRLAELLP